MNRFNRLICRKRQFGIVLIEPCLMWSSIPLWFLFSNLAVVVCPFVWAKIKMRPSIEITNIHNTKVEFQKCHEKKKKVTQNGTNYDHSQYCWLYALTLNGIFLHLLLQLGLQLIRISFFFIETLRQHRWTMRCMSLCKQNIDMQSVANSAAGCT